MAVPVSVRIVLPVTSKVPVFSTQRNHPSPSFLLDAQRTQGSPCRWSARGLDVQPVGGRTRHRHRAEIHRAGDPIIVGAMPALAVDLLDTAEAIALKVLGSRVKAGPFVVVDRAAARAEGRRSSSTWNVVHHVAEPVPLVFAIFQRREVQMAALLGPEDSVRCHGPATHVVPMVQVPPLTCVPESAAPEASKVT